MAFSGRTMSRALLATTTAVAIGVTAAAPAAQADPAPTAQAHPRLDASHIVSWVLRQAVTPKGVFEHLKALQKIADRNNDTRVSGTAGFDQSADYAERVLRRAGYRVTRQSFEFTTYIPKSPTELARVAPSAGDLAVKDMSYSGSGVVEAAASVPVGAAQGCAETDFGPANAGTVVVVSRGACTFGQKAQNAEKAGASAIVIYNNVAGELSGTLGATFAGNIVAVGITQELGAELVAQVPAGLKLRVKVDAFRGEAKTENVFAESKWGDPDNVVMAGAHLDSVAAGPGINDNGTGSAALLEIAEQMRWLPTRNKVRFALWGAEESGLVGSTHYIANLPEAERDKIALYLNFDMVGSPNYARFVYDGDNSAFPPGQGSAKGPEGSGAIEKLFHDYFASQGLKSSETAFSGRSDYGPFIAEGVDIPAGGLFTGAEGIKTEAEAAVYGGTAGEAYDKCYHQACDTIENVSRDAIAQMSDAVAHAIITYAFDTSSVTEPADSAPVTGTGPGNPGGGGLHDHDHEVVE